MYSVYFKDTIYILYYDIHKPVLKVQYVSIFKLSNALNTSRMVYHQTACKVFTNYQFS